MILLSHFCHSPTFFNATWTTPVSMGGRPSRMQRTHQRLAWICRRSGRHLQPVSLGFSKGFIRVLWAKSRVNRQLFVRCSKRPFGLAKALCDLVVAALLTERRTLRSSERFAPSSVAGSNFSFLVEQLCRRTSAN